MPEKKRAALVPVDDIASRIYVIRGHKVMLDFDLAALYGVETRVLMQAVRRNSDRFPEDFFFQMSPDEFADWRSQIVMSNPAARMGLRRPPYAFTEHGALQLASVLKSNQAAQMSILVVRAFVKLRELLSSNRELARKLEDLERKVGRHDETISAIIDAIRKLMEPPASGKKRPIGYIHPKEDE